MNVKEALEQYQIARKEAQRCYSDCIRKGVSPYPEVLDDILENVKTAGTRNIGLIDIPTELVVGTKTGGRVNAFAANFMPLFPHETEFGSKWISLCRAHLDETGIRDPIQCYEYMGKFYILEGNKRFSVLKSFSAATVPGTVTRILPERNGDGKVELYYEFTEFYSLSRLYNISFRKPGSYRLLQAAMGFDPDHVWTETEQRSFSSLMYYIRRIMLKADCDVSLAGDVVLSLLKIYTLPELKDMSLDDLALSIRKIQPEVELLEKSDPIALSTDTPDSSEGLLTKLINTIVPGCLNVAFINEFSEEKSPWILAHETGRRYVEKLLGDRISTASYVIPGPDMSEKTFDEAVGNGADVIFATTPSLIAASRRAALKYPDIKVLNCSVSMPFPEVRTYYSRIYEGKFISGAVAGAMTKTGKLGYVASSPIYGVPAGINAFALGASLTNPDARVFLRWTSVSIDTFSELKALGADMLSNRDIPVYTLNQDAWGLNRIGGGGELIPVCSPYWNWGKIYARIIKLILDGAWNDLESVEKGRAINYWLGMESGAVDIRLADNVPESVRALAGILKDGLSSGGILPFRREIYSQDGTLKNSGERSLSTEEILRMDWLCDRVEGSIPEYDELLPIAKNIVSLQGVYRERIAPEKGRLIL